MPFPAFYSPHGAEELFCMAFPAVVLSGGGRDFRWGIRKSGR